MVLPHDSIVVSKMKKIQKAQQLISTALLRNFKRFKPQRVEEEIIVINTQPQTDKEFMEDHVMGEAMCDMPDYEYANNGEGL